MRLIIALLGSLLSACVVGSGNLETRSFPVEGFDAIDASDAFDVEIVRGERFAVSVTADDNVWRLVAVRREGSTLRLGIDPETARSGVTLRASVSMPTLVGLTLSGGSHARFEGFDAPVARLAVHASGSSHAAGSLRADALVVDLSGDSGVHLGGAVQSASLVASGGSGLDLATLSLVEADVELSGSSDATISVAEHLDYDLSGGSHLVYLGRPRLGRTSISGGSEAEQR